MKDHGFILGYEHFLLFCFAMRTLSHEKTSSRENLNDSARTRQKFSHRKFASQQCSYIAVFMQERFLGNKFPCGISLNIFRRKCLSEGRILAEKLAGRSIVAEHFVLNPQEGIFSAKPVANFSKRMPGNKISGKDPLQEIENHSYHDKLVFKQICDLEILQRNYLGKHSDKLF